MTNQINSRQYQEFDIVMLPTKNKTLLYTKSNGSLATMPLDSIGSNQHLYIISNDKLEKNDWCWIKNHYGEEYVAIFNGKSFDIINNGGNFSPIDYKNCAKKIIATTNILKTGEIYHPQFIIDKSVIEYTLPQIPQSFIEHYITEYNKGNIISKVLVEVEDYWVKVAYSLDVAYRLKLNENNEISIFIEEPSIIHQFVKEVQEEFNDINLEYLTFAADKFVNKLSKTE